MISGVNIIHGKANVASFNGTGRSGWGGGRGGARIPQRGREKGSKEHLDWFT